MNKRIIFISALVITTFLMISCVSAEGLFDFFSNDGADVKNDEKTLIVGFNSQFPPFGYQDDNGNYTGFDLDLAKEVCKRNNWTYVPQPIIDWNSKQLELDGGEIDCIWSEFTINGREDNYTWSEPYFNNTKVVIVKENSNISSISDLKGKTIEIQQGSSFLNVLKNNKPLQSYILSAASDKIAQQASSASIVSTMLNGILIGDMGLATTLSMIGMLPSILFAAYGAKYAGKHGHKESIVSWTRNCIIANIVMIAFFMIVRHTVGTQTIAHMGITMIAFVVLTFVVNGFAMCVTTANTGFMADIIDYELDRSGKYIPAVISGTYSLVDKIVSSFSAAIATGCVALIGYTATMPQPGDPATPGVFYMTMFLRYGLAILGWICTLLAMRGCKLTKDEMVHVQKRIADKKAEAQGKFFEEELHKGDKPNA